MASTIEYNGYIGSIEHSPEDKCFFKKLEMIDKFIAFKVTTAEELENNFQNVIDEYMQPVKGLDVNLKRLIKEYLIFV